MGRKGKSEEWLKPENLILISGWRRDGLSDAQIAKNIGINRTTLYDWMKRYSDFSNAYKKGTEVSTYEVENALYKAACGYFVEEVEKTETTYADGTKTTTKKGHKRYIPPNTAAQIFILKNRRPNWWKDKREIEMPETVTDDGFLKALNGSAKEDWSENEEVETDSVSV